MMLSSFTDPYPNELLYSAFARQHFYSGNIDLKDTLRELFNKDSVIPNFEIGSNLNSLCSNLGHHYNPIDLIQKHTIFPYYAPFLPADRKRELITTLCTSDAMGVLTKIGIIAGSICENKAIRYCPQCAATELPKLGEAYIHREHQLQGILYCPHDGSLLKNYPINKDNVSRVEYIRLDENLLNLTIKVINKPHLYKKHMEISKAAYYLLSNDLSHATKSFILKRYKELLYQKNLTTTSLRVKQEQLHEDFVSYYGQEFLLSLESLPEEDDEYNWLRVATRNVKRTVHPLRHILLINYLSNNDIASFFNKTNHIMPFGSGPWPCLNKVAAHYLQPVIPKVTITSDFKTRDPIGTFECNCGFIYARKGPDKNNNDKYHFGRIKQFGAIWEERLKVLLSDKSLTQRTIATELGCDPCTVKKYSSKLASQMTPVLQTNDNTKQTIYKKSIIAAVKNGLSRKEIHDTYSKEYTYLYRHYKEWLFTNLPPAKKPKGSKGYVNWEQRDQKVKAELEAAYNKLIRQEKPIHISKTTLGKTTGRLVWLDKYSDKLPLSIAYIQTVSETTRDFQIRRCKIIINKKRQEGLPVRIWELQREAGLKSKDMSEILPVLEKYIDASQGAA